MKKSARQLDAEIGGHARKRKSKKSADEIRFGRLETLKEIMADAVGDPAWRDADIFEIEKWISVDDDLSDREWLDAAKNQLADQSVLPEHAGAAPANVYRWNDAFISTYRMNIDQGMSREDAINSARQNANDTVKLTVAEHTLTNADPKLYGDALAKAGPMPGAFSGLMSDMRRLSVNRDHFCTPRSEDWRDSGCRHGGR